VQSNPELIQVGKSMVFYKDEFKILLDNALNQVRLKDITRIQKNSKRYLVNKKIQGVIKEINRRVAEKRRIKEEKLKQEMEERLKKEKEEREGKHRLSMIEKSKLTTKSQHGTNANSTV